MEQSSRYFPKSNRETFTESTKYSLENSVQWKKIPPMGIEFEPSLSVTRTATVTHRLDFSGVSLFSAFRRQDLIVQWLIRVPESLPEMPGIDGSSHTTFTAVVEHELPVFAEFSLQGTYVSNDSETNPWKLSPSKSSVRVPKSKKDFFAHPVCSVE